MTETWAIGGGSGEQQAAVGQALGGCASVGMGEGSQAGRANVLFFLSCEG